MKCPFCNAENPEGAVFCKHCGKHLSEVYTQCPVCREPCSQSARFCPHCGTPILGARPVYGRRRLRETSYKTLELTSGIFMMAGVLIALVFVFFLGTKQRLSGGYSENYDVWHFFGRAYTLLQSTLAGHNYSGYTITAHCLPVVLSTIIGAGTIVATVVFAMLAALKFGLHFKRPNEHYYKFATMAVFSFILGATLFDCIHSASLENQNAALNATTVAGLVMCCFCIIGSLSVKAVMLWNDMPQRQRVLNCVCALAGILFLAMLSGFAITEQVSYEAAESWRNSYSINYYYLNASISFMYDADSSIPADYISAFIFALLAVLTQIAVQVLAFSALIRHIGDFGSERTFSLGLAIALAAVSAAYLTCSAVGAEMINGLTIAGEAGWSKLWLNAAPIMTLVDSLLYLATTITYRALTKKEDEVRTI